MAKRLPGNSEIISLPFGQTHRLDDGTEIKLRGNPEPRWSSEDRIGFNQATAEEARAVAGEGQGLFRVWMSAGRGGFPVQLPLTIAARSARDDWDAADDPTMKCVSQPDTLPKPLR